MLFPTHDKLNWSVRQESILTESGIEVPKYNAIVREDTNKVLSVMGSDYYPYQNSELIALLERVSNQTGMEVKNSGSFGDGQKVFIQLKSNDLKLGNDRIEGYLTGINSYDGSTSLAFGPSNVTISCQNTFYAAFRDMNNKVRHTKNMVIKIDDICKGLEDLVKEEKKIFDNIIKLSETRFDSAIQESVTRKLFDVKKEFKLNDEKLSTQTKNKLSRFHVNLHGEISEKGENLWGLFSGITKYTSHSISNEYSGESKMLSVYSERERKIFNELCELV